jgi:hypothetical protein
MFNNQEFKNQLNFIGGPFMAGFLGVVFGRPFNFYNKLMQNVIIYAVGYLCTIYGTLDTIPLLAGLYGGLFLTSQFC